MFWFYKVNICDLKVAAAIAMMSTFGLNKGYMPKLTFFLSSVSRSSQVCISRC